MRRFFLFALSCAMLFAQSDRGTITGTVSDAGGAQIPNVAITATHLDTNTQFKTSTTASGEFNLPSLPVGRYRVAIQMEGFKAHIRDNVTLEAGSPVRLDTKLEVGAVQQSIEVTADSTLLQADNAKIVNSMSDRLIEGLPTISRSDMLFTILALSACSRVLSAVTSIDCCTAPTSSLVSRRTGEPASSVTLSRMWALKPSIWMATR